MTAQTVRRSYNINSIQSAARSCGSHWFDPDTMRSFGCRVHEQVYHGPGGIFFVSSEKCYSGKRASSVRQFSPHNAGIDTVGEFNELSRDQAHRRAKRLAEQPLAVQLITALKALDEAVTGTTLPTTFAAAAHYPTLDELTRHELIYLAGDQGYTRVSVHEYDDGSGYYLQLVQTGTTDRQRAWSDAYKLVREVCRILNTYAHGDYTEDAEVIASTHRPISDAEQFHADCKKHGNPKASRRACDELRRLSARHHRLMERECNFGGLYDENGDERPTLRRLLLQLKQAAARVGASSVLCSGDPRGCTVKLTWPDGECNDFGKEGWCVPIQ